MGKHTLQPFRLNLWLFRDKLEFLEDSLDTAIQNIRLPLHDRLQNTLFSKYMHDASKNDLRQLFRDTMPQKPFFINTHGIMHHLTYGVLYNIAHKTRDIGYIHIDNHVDFGYKPGSNGVGHSTFVSDLMDEGLIENALFIGDSRRGTMSVSKKEFGTEPFRDTVSSYLDQLPRSIYVSIDVDAFSPAYINTPFLNGSMDWNSFETVLELFSDKDIIGADVTGYPTDPSPLDEQTYSTIAKAILGEQYNRDTYLEQVRSHLENISSPFLKSVLQTTIE